MSIISNAVLDGTIDAIFQYHKSQAENQQKFTMPADFKAQQVVQPVRYNVTIRPHVDTQAPRT